MELQADLVLRHVCVPQKRRANVTQNFHLKQRISCGVEDLQPHPIYSMTSGHTDL